MADTDHTESVHSHARDGGVKWKRIAHSLSHFIAHDHAETSVTDTGAAGIRATKVSLVALGITAGLQGIIVVFSGSVALLSDTLHNVTDALTAIPLWMAFALGRRQSTRTYTHGFGRVEDFAGLLIVGAIGVSAAFVVWESVQRLGEPRLLEYIPWVIAAGLIGAAGNELVARYRIRVGRAIGSEALITDGHHARTDAWTSLAVVAAAVGAFLGAAWVDPVAGLVVAAGIVTLMVRSGRRIVRRLLDGVEPGIVAEAQEAVRGVAGVIDVTELRARWNGHVLHIETSIEVDAQASLTEGHDVAHAVEQALRDDLATPVSSIVHVGPPSREID